VQLQTNAKTTRQEIKESKRQKTALDIEHSRVTYAYTEAMHVRNEAERQRQHEVLIWDWKLEMVRLQAGIRSQMFPPSQAPSNMLSTDVFGNTDAIPESSHNTPSLGAFEAPSALDLLDSGAYTWGSIDDSIGGAGLEYNALSKNLAS
jgi:hypothetical protein